MYTAILDDGTRIECHTYEVKSGGVVLMDEGGRRLSWVPNTSLNYTVRGTMESEDGDEGRVWSPPER